ncbi:MAG TPA: TetR/AcrR family transcriptional regulator [Vicinamibacteria bacterium]|nr:TetR/AcrR family transcriptional regulator [Vicinamibacteria bacterium]
MSRTAQAPSPSPDRILLSGLELFSRKGYDATSVREICAAAGITKPTLYHFYGSKEGVYRALVDGALDDFRRAITRALQSPGSAAERLRRVARGYFERARGRRDLLRFIFGLIHNPASSAPRTDFPRFYDEVVAQIASEVEAGVEGGEFVPGRTDLRMLVLMGALGEALCGYLIVGKPQLSATLADALTDTVISGWRPALKVRR